MGNGLGMQDYAGRFFANDSKPPWIVEYPGKFKDNAARDKFRESIQKSQSQENRHKVMVLEDGMAAKALGLTNKDSQFLEARQASATEVCGIYRVPPHKIGLLDRATHSNIEHQGIEFVTDCMRPIGVRWEHRVNSDLIQPVNEALGEGEYFGEFILDGLLRGDLKSRYDAYQVGRNGGWLCPNDVCAFEGLNPIPDDKGGNDYLRPVNYQVAGEEPVQPDTSDDTGKDNAIPEGQPAPDETDEGEDTAKAKTNRRLLELYAQGIAGRNVRKEVAALRKALAKSPDTFTEQATAFYAMHVQLVAETMCIPAAAAKKYCDSNLKMIAEVSDPATALDWIEDTAAQELAALALGIKSPAQLTEGVTR
jgi:hypothetical protein